MKTFLNDYMNRSVMGMELTEADSVLFILQHLIRHARNINRRMVTELYLLAQSCVAFRTRC